MLMVTRPIKKVTYRKELPPINSHDPSMWSSCGVIWQVKYINISTCRKRMDTKLDKVLIYSGWPPSILKPHDPFITWSI